MFCSTKGRLFRESLKKIVITNSKCIRVCTFFSFYTRVVLEGVDAFFFCAVLDIIGVSKIGLQQIQQNFPVIEGKWFEELAQWAGFLLKACSIGVRAGLLAPLDNISEIYAFVIDHRGGPAHPRLHFGFMRHEGPLEIVVDKGMFQSGGSSTAEFVWHQTQGFETDEVVVLFI